MPDWSKSMQQSYEYYEVDPGTWRDKRLLTNVTNGTIQRDSDAATLGSATVDVTESVGECYIRVYLVTVQNGITERTPLGTFLVQTPSSSFDGKIRSVSMDAYTPLLELKENPPPIGYYVPEGSNIMETAHRLIDTNVRAPVVAANSESTLHYDFVANTSDTWLTFTRDLIANANYEFGLDEMGRILFSPKQDTVSLQPVWTYTDDNSSILYPDMTIYHDLYDIPNVVEVVYSKNGLMLTAIIKNDDSNSPTSIQRRGREITHRDTNPNLSLPAGNLPRAQKLLNDYAEQLLKSLSTIEYSVSYTHAYCPVRIGDCVRLDYSRAGLNNVKAKVISQSISCKPGCRVNETAVFTAKLWG